MWYDLLLVLFQPIPKYYRFDQTSTGWPFKSKSSYEFRITAIRVSIKSNSHTCSTARSFCLTSHWAISLIMSGSNRRQCTWRNLHWTYVTFGTCAWIKCILNVNNSHFRIDPFCYEWEAGYTIYRKEVADLMLHQYARFWNIWSVLRIYI